jgi:hypothetical protein
MSNKRGHEDLLSNAAYRLKRGRRGEIKKREDGPFYIDVRKNHLISSKHLTKSLI